MGVLSDSRDCDSVRVLSDDGLESLGKSGQVLVSKGRAVERRELQLDMPALRLG